MSSLVSAILGWGGDKGNRKVIRQHLLTEYIGHPANQLITNPNHSEKKDLLLIQQQKNKFPVEISSLL